MSSKKNGAAAGQRGKKLPSQKKLLMRTTTKEERKAMKQEKKAGSVKTETERLAETEDIKKKLLEWGLDQRFEPIKQLHLVMDTFVKSGEAVKGVIPFIELPPQPMGRNICYVFPKIRGNRCTCDLIVRDGQEYFKNESRSKLPVLNPADFPSQPSQQGHPTEASSFSQEAYEKMLEIATNNQEGPMGARETDDARHRAEQLVPSVDEIQREFDRMFLPSADHIDGSCKKGCCSHTTSSVDNNFHIRSSPPNITQNVTGKVELID